MALMNVLLSEVLIFQTRRTYTSPLFKTRSSYGELDIYYIDNRLRHIVSKYAEIIRPAILEMCGVEGPQQLLVTMEGNKLVQVST